MANGTSTHIYLDDRTPAQREMIYAQLVGVESFTTGIREYRESHNYYGHIYTVGKEKYVTDKKVKLF